MADECREWSVVRKKKRVVNCEQKKGNGSEGMRERGRIRVNFGFKYLGLIN